MDEACQRGNTGSKHRIHLTWIRCKCKSWHARSHFTADPSFLYEIEENQSAVSSLDLVVMERFTKQQAAWVDQIKLKKVTSIANFSVQPTPISCYVHIVFFWHRGVSSWHVIWHIKCVFRHTAWGCCNVCLLLFLSRWNVVDPFSEEAVRSDWARQQCVGVLMRHVWQFMHVWMCFCLFICVYCVRYLCVCVLCLLKCVEFRLEVCILNQMKKAFEANTATKVQKHCLHS